MCLVQCFELHLRQVRLLVGHRENVLGVLDRGKRTDFEARSEKNVFLLPVASASAAERNRRAVPACEITAVTITLRMQARQHFLARHTATRPPTRTLPLAGKTDMLETMKAYRDIGFDGVLRPDHVPTVEGDSNENAGYSAFGRLYAIGYIRGLHEAVYAK